MPVRLLLILAILIQQLALPIAIGRAEPAECAATSCCQLVETTSCCGETVLVHSCAKTGGACHCSDRPGDSEPAPKAPRPQRQHDLEPVFVAGPSSAVDSPTEAPAYVRLTCPAIHRTHNETQALLCIWTT
ncbi:MAG: hypothetical protein KAS72_14145 [Phycisphaerales bacterium]|nr:hypothetical protein [Phycisphaerales bacterium]